MGFIVGNAAAQEANMADEIKDQFYMQYPYATDLRIQKKGNFTAVSFAMKKEQYEAFYKKETWSHTLMNYSFERLPKKVVEGVKHSKIAALPIEAVSIVYIPSGYETYRMQLKQPLRDRKYYYFNEAGRLLGNSSYRD